MMKEKVYINKFNLLLNVIVCIPEVLKMSSYFYDNDIKKEIEKEFEKVKEIKEIYNIEIEKKKKDFKKEIIVELETDKGILKILVELYQTGKIKIIFSDKEIFSYCAGYPDDDILDNYVWSIITIIEILSEKVKKQ